MIDMSKLEKGWSWTNPTAKSPGTNTTGFLGGGGPLISGQNPNQRGTPQPQYGDFGANDPYSSWTPDDAFNQNYGGHGGNVYNITDKNWATGDDPKQKNIQQNWWRNDQWGGPTPEGSVYNPYYGFQDVNQVMDFYRNAEGPVTWDQFQQAGWTPNLTGFPGWYQDGGGESGGNKLTPQPGDTMGTDWEAYFRDGGGYNDAQYPTNPYDPSQLQTPGEWDTASTVAQNYAYGMPTQSPWEWDAAAQATTNQPWYNAMKGVVQTDTNDQIKQAAEQAGLGGMRWSTPLGRTAQDISGRNMAQLGTQWAGMEQAAQEAAQGRLMQTGSNKAGLQESARDRALQATGLLSQLGGQKTDYARGLASDLMSGGTTMAGQTNQMAENIYQQFLKSTPEGNPWLQAALGLGSTPGTPQTYQQSGASSLLSGLGSLAPLLIK